MSNIQNDQVLSFLSVAQCIQESEYRAVPINLAFTGTVTSFTLTMQNMQARDFIRTIRALWVDNTASSSILFITNLVSGQTLQIAPGSQGYVNFLCPSPAQIIFTSTGAVTVQVTLLNYPVLDSQWNVSGTGTITMSGTLSNAQVLALNTAPPMLIAGVPGFLIRPIIVTLENVNGGVAYTGGGNLNLNYGGVLANVTSQTIPATFLTAPTVTTIETAMGTSSANPSSQCVGVGINIGAATANFAVGTGTIKYNISYQLIGGF